MSVSANSDNHAQLDKMKQDQERRLNRLREDYDKRETSIREAGEAAVSHIKTSTEARIDQTQTSSAQKIRAAEERASRDYGDLKRRTQQSTDLLDEKARHAELAAEKRISDAQHLETRVIDRTNSELRDFLARQQELKAQARESAAKSVAKVRTEGNEQLALTKEQAAEQLRRVEFKSKTDMQELNERNRAVYDQAKNEADRRVADARRDGEMKIAQDQRQKNKTLREIDIKFHDAATAERRMGEEHLNQLKKQDQEQFDKTRSGDIELARRVHDEYEKETQRVQVQGEGEVRRRQENFENLRKKQEDSNQQRLLGMEEDYKVHEQKLRKESEARMQTEALTLDQNLKQQRVDFKERFDVNDKTFKGSLQNQKESYLKALYKQKQKFDAEFGKQSARASDPFYRLKDFDAGLVENQGSYVLNAKVAPYDKDSVDIIVKDDRIILSGHRSFADDFTGDDGARSTTNSFQTYRQEFKVDIPIDSKLARKKIAEDGSITVIAPKKGYPQTKA